jgi:hypothetical protein
MKLKITNIIFTFLLLLLLNSCVPDPRNAADANRTTVLAAQDAADRVQARAQADQDFQQAQAERQATEQSRTWALNLIIRGGGMALTLAICIALAGIGTGISWAGVGAGRAVARFAEIRASLIPLNAETRQFPLIVHYIGHGRFTWGNPNTEGVVMLDSRNPSHRQLIVSSGAVQLAGVVAREARRSKDPAGVALVQPVVINGDNTKGDNDETDQ